MGQGRLDDVLRRPSLAHRVARVWSAFWFASAPTTTDVALRTALGVVVLAWALTLAPDLRAFYGTGGLGPATQAPDDGRLSLLAVAEATGTVPPDLAVAAVLVALVAAALALVLGRAVRTAAVTQWLCLLTLQGANPLPYNSGEVVLRLWALYVAVHAVLTPARLLRGTLWDRGPAPHGPVWLLRLVRVQLTVIYLGATVAKLQGATWQGGTAALYALGIADYERMPLPGLVRQDLLLGNLLTWGVVAVELSLPFLLWTRRTRRAAVVLGVSLHLGLEYALMVGFFLPAMLVGYVAFLEPDEVRALVGRARRALSGGR